MSADPARGTCCCAATQSSNTSPFSIIEPSLYATLVSMAAIIFDLDGTIAASFDYVAEFLVAEACCPPLSGEPKANLRGLSMAAMARELGLHWWRLPFLFHKGLKGMRYSINRVYPFAGMPEVIEKVHAEGHELFMLSSNSVRNVRQFLRHHNLYKYFLEI